MRLLTTIILLLTLTMATSSQKPRKTMPKYYCEYCGRSFPDVRQLASAPCAYHPDGTNRGRHKLYEGSEKSRYTCRYCGTQFSTIMQMVTAPCAYHPKGTNKGRHSPAL